MYHIAKYIYTILLVFFTFPAVMGNESYCFRIYLKDKNASGYSVEQPERFLSSESIAHRKKYNLPVTEEDLPVSQSYIDIISAYGLQPILTSKWMNTVVASATDSSVIHPLLNLHIVDSVKLVWKGDAAYSFQREINDSIYYHPADTLLISPYGYAKKQIEMLKGDYLHDTGYKGENIRIAVIDAGFLNVDKIAFFDSLQVIGMRNMVNPEMSVYHEDEHGTKVLSCIAANLPGIMVGTAPQASFLLIKSEDIRSEFPIEEDYWVAAVEYADSVGVDIITSSLGYYTFDANELSYSPSQLDGNSAFITRAANRVTDKGILLLSSAGNEGNGQWKKITFPADGHNMLSIGAIQDNGDKSSFSSYGYTVDGRIKPDVVALGSVVCVVDSGGRIRFANGTSFATPILAGLAACLWQAMPEYSNLEIMELIRQSADRYNDPTIELGYGLPDMYKALIKGKEYVQSVE